MSFGSYFRRTRRRIGSVVWSTVGSYIFRGLAATWRIETLEGDEFELRNNSGVGQILALWHGRMLLGLPHHGKRGMQVLVSPSSDGDLAKKLLTSYGYRVIRGSSSRRGSRALREMLSALGDGKNIVITPDGPRGPRHSMNPGPAFMACETGKMLIPIGLACDRAWRLKSWDRFTIPKPCARVVIKYEEPITVPRESSEAELEHCTSELKARILQAEVAAFEHLGLPLDW